MSLANVTDTLTAVIPLLASVRSVPMTQGVITAIAVLTVSTESRASLGSLILVHPVLVTAELISAPLQRKETLECVLAVKRGMRDKGVISVLMVSMATLMLEYLASAVLVTATLTLTERGTVITSRENVRIV